MRFVALAFGIIAGLVASLVLALGGLDLELLAIDQKQLAGVRFGLFVVANLGVFGAGLVLGAPIAAAALFALGAVGWIVAAILLRHGPDLVMLVPPGLLILSGAISLFAGLRARRVELPPLNYAPVRQPAREIDAEEDLDPSPEPVPEPYDELPPISVGAGFFGEGGTAMPLGSSNASIGGNVGELDDEPPRRGMDDWRPGRKRTPPPRTKPAFKEIDEGLEADEESGFSRFARGTSTLLSFGLYAALAGAAILIFLNLQSGNGRNPTAAVDASTPSTSPEIAAARASSRASASSGASSEAVAAVASTQAASPTVSSVSLPPLVSSAASEAVAALDAVPSVSPQDPTDSLSGPASIELPQAASAEAAASVEAPSAEPSAPETLPAADSSVIMPWPVPTQLAAERMKPAPRKPVQTTAPATPAPNTTGL